MNKDSAWGLALLFVTLVAAYTYYRVNWWFNWRRSRGTLPMYGQCWASPHGKHLYILGIEARRGDLGPTIVFADTNPAMHSRYNTFSWTFNTWKREVDERQLVLVNNSWLKESS